MLLGATSLSLSMRDQNVVLKVPILWDSTGSVHCCTVTEVLNECCAAAVLVGGSDSSFSEDESDDRLIEWL